MSSHLPSTGPEIPGLSSSAQPTPGLYPGSGLPPTGGAPFLSGTPDPSEQKAASCRTQAKVALVLAIIPVLSPLAGMLIAIVALVNGRGLRNAGRGKAIAAIMISVLWMVAAAVATWLFFQIVPETHCVNGTRLNGACW
jgi:hypothetical protein